MSFLQSPNSKYLKINAITSIDELRADIKRCQDLIADSNQCSVERKWLVRFLVDLRFRVQKLENPSDILLNTEVYCVGHHFEICNPSRKLSCDQCCGAIWGISEECYMCKDCNFVCHLKCIDFVRRVCSHVVATEKNELQMEICPEIGLAAQQFKCAECKTSIGFQFKKYDARLCDYSGLYFCSSCHWNDTCEIPARVVHNWDWDKRRVSRAAYQLLKLTNTMPLINLESINEKLFNLVTELNYVRKLRNDLRLMMKYLLICRKGNCFITGEILRIAETPKFYSFEDLRLVNDGRLEARLSQIAEECRNHIIACEICVGRGYICELCINEEVIFPFDSSSFGCTKCNSYFHRSCWTKKQQICPKCARIAERNKNRSPEEEIIYDIIA